jgi:hypothetical protein
MELHHFAEKKQKHEKKQLSNLIFELIFFFLKLNLKKFILTPEINDPVIVFMYVVEICHHGIYKTKKSKQ